jgi:hypothetical protein
MEIYGINLLMKLKLKNRGNSILCSEVDKLILDIDSFTGNNIDDLKFIRKDADCVHEDGFYFFDIQHHRVLVQLSFKHIKTATITWVGNHQDYERTFKNNKQVIEKWLRSSNNI